VRRPFLCSNERHVGALFYVHNVPSCAPMLPGRLSLKYQALRKSLYDVGGSYNQPTYVNREPGTATAFTTFLACTKNE